MKLGCWSADMALSICFVVSIISKTTSSESEAAVVHFHPWHSILLHAIKYTSYWEWFILLQNLIIPEACNDKVPQLAVNVQHTVFGTLATKNKGLSRQLAIRSLTRCCWLKNRTSGDHLPPCFLMISPLWSCGGSGSCHLITTKMLSLNLSRNEIKDTSILSSLSMQKKPIHKAKISWTFHSSDLPRALMLLPTKGSLYYGYKGRRINTGGILPV